jgi:hypothetical protein
MCVKCSNLNSTELMNINPILNRGVNLYFIKPLLNLIKISLVVPFILKVAGNEKEGGSRRWQMIGIGLRPRRSRLVCLINLLSSLILCIYVSAPVEQNQ